MTNTLIEPPIQVFVEEHSKRAASGEAIRKLIGTPGHFRSWLEAQEGADAECVGYSHLTDMCPLATWLRETTDDYTIEISESCMTWQLGEMLLPGWMFGFVYLIDGRYATDSDISASGALCVLSTVESLDYAAPTLTASVPEAVLV